MKKTLVAYFSASGVTKKVAKLIASKKDADLFEIIPQQIYTKEDLDWTNTESRSTLEMKDVTCRPAITCSVESQQYDTIYLGFPIWWGREPSVIDTFLDQTDLAGKTVIPFCTSGSGDCSGATASIRRLCGDAVTVQEGIRLAADVTVEDLADL